jgi:WS/DGAT C-terminal domain
MLEVWPLVPTYHSAGFNVALFSYDGNVHFELNADRDLVPDLERFGQHLEEAAASLSEAVRGPGDRRSERAASRTASSSARRSAERAARGGSRRAADRPGR